MDKDYELASEIINRMIDKYTKKENTAFKNATLDILAKIRDKVHNKDAEIISRVIEFYGPEVGLVEKPEETEKLGKIDILSIIKKYNPLSRKSKLKQNQADINKASCKQDCKNCNKANACSDEKLR